MKTLNELPKSTKEKILKCQLEWSPNVIKEAQMYLDALSEPGVNQNLLAGAIGRKRSYIASVIRMLQLPDEVRDLLSKGKLSFSQAREILRVIPEMQVRLAEDCVREKWTVRELKDHVAATRLLDAEMKQISHNLYEKKGLVSQVQAGSKGSFFVRFGFGSQSALAEFLKKLEKL